MHYINDNLDGARAKFKFRKEFNTKIFDSKLATDEVRERYRLWEDKWTTEEGMPSGLVLEFLKIQSTITSVQK